MSTCDNCSLNLSLARIRQNWHLLGPLTQISRDVGLPQGVIEIIGSYLVPPHHTVTCQTKRPIPDGNVVSSAGYEYGNITYTFCRYCLAAGLTAGLLKNKRLPYLRCHIEFFVPRHMFFWAKYVKDFAHQCELPEHYNCSYYRTRSLMIREGLPNLITSS